MSPTARENGIDALRTLAVLAMMAAHTSRLIDFDVRPAWAHWILLLEPLIPTLFLFLVGMSLTHSHRKAGNPRSWLFRQARRALGLWLLSALFFSLEEGMRLPDAFVASGILCTIAYAILLVGSLLMISGPAWYLGVVLAVGIAAFVGIDRAGAKPFLWVSGNSPLFPLTLFALSGALWGIFQKRFPRVASGLALPAVAAAIWMLSRYGWDSLFDKPFGRSDASHALAPPLWGHGARVIVPYYNLRPGLAALCLCVHVGALGTFRLLRVGERFARIAFALGRHALGAYIMHLSLLASLVVTFGLRPLGSARLGNTVLLGVIALCWAWAAWREKVSVKPV